MTIIVVLAIAGGVVGYVATRQSKPAATEQVAAVRKAYLAWWKAAKQAYYRLDPSPMKPLMTAGGYEEELGNLRAQQEADEPIDIEVASHDMQIVVYRESSFASVDDIWKSQDVSLDPTTHSPISEPTNDFTEESTTLKLSGGAWLVDSRGTFGSSSPAVSGTSISFAAVPGDQPTTETRSELVSAFHNFTRVRNQAYLNLTPDLLSSVEVDPELAGDTQNLQKQVARNQPIRYVQQDNYRIGMQSDSVAWIYDTLLDQSAILNGKTRRPVKSAQPNVLRLRFRLSKGANGWMVDGIGGN